MSDDYFERKLLEAVDAIEEALLDVDDDSIHSGYYTDLLEEAISNIRQCIYVSRGELYTFSLDEEDF